MRRYLPLTRKAGLVLYAVVVLFGTLMVVEVRPQEAGGDSSYSTPTPTPQPSYQQASAQHQVGSNASSNSESFWSTAPGLLTAIAAIISAVAALVTAIYSRGKISDR